MSDAPFFHRPALLIITDVFVFLHDNRTLKLWVTEKYWWFVSRRKSANRSALLAIRWMLKASPHTITQMLVAKSGEVNWQQP
jgi:hypothetical protein